jgi:undecaprenyl phosphate N,N'-diacetylbacillosamine 1-phosphate transferase
MNDNKDAHRVLLSDSQRLTRIGSLVRKTSLDELPKIIDVVNWLGD